MCAFRYLYKLKKFDKQETEEKSKFGLPEAVKPAKLRAVGMATNAVALPTTTPTTVVVKAPGILCD